MLSATIAIIAVSQAGSSTQTPPKSAGFFTFEGKRYEFRKPSSKIEKRDGTLYLSSSYIVQGSEGKFLNFNFDCFGIYPGYFRTKSEYSGNCGFSPINPIHRNSANVANVSFTNLPFKEANLLENARSFGTGEQEAPFSGTFKLTRIGTQPGDTVVLKLEFSTTLNGVNGRGAAEKSFRTGVVKGEVTFETSNRVL